MATELTERIGQRIRQRRLELEMSAGDLARELPGKVDATQVYRWEKGKHRMHDDTLEAIARVLRVDMAYFVAPDPGEETETPDLMDALSGKTQLDRIERMLATLLSRTEALEDFERTLHGESSPTTPEHDASSESAAPAQDRQRPER